MSTYQLSIPKPCHESWEGMAPDAQGRFCSKCAATVVDFTTMNAAEVEAFLNTTTATKICGRLKPEQMLRKNRTAKMALASLIIAVSATFVGCKHKDEGFPLGELAYPEDTIKKEQTAKDTPAVTGKVHNHAAVQKEQKPLPPPPQYTTGDISVTKQPSDSIPNK